MAAETSAVFSTDSKERKNADPETVLYQTGTGGRSPTRGVFGLGASVDTILENLKLLLLGPVIAALVAFAVISAVPRWYTSVAYLALDEAGARVADARMQSIPVLDQVLVHYNAPKSTLEARRRYIDENRRIVVAPGETAKTSNLFRMEYTDKSPAVAQKVNSLFIEAWLESTKPPPDKRELVENDIDRLDLQSKSITQLIDRLQKDAPSLLTPQSLQGGELATPVSGLIARRDQNLAALYTLRNSLKGMSRDVIFGAPDLPEEPTWPKRGIITILAGFVTGLLLLMFVILRRFGPKLI